MIDLNLNDNINIFNPHISFPPIVEITAFCSLCLFPLLFLIPSHTKYTHTSAPILTCAWTSHDDVLAWDGVKTFRWQDQGQQSCGGRVTGNWLLDLTTKPCAPVLFSFPTAVRATWSRNCDGCADSN